MPLFLAAVVTDSTAASDLSLVASRFDITDGAVAAGAEADKLVVVGPAKGEVIEASWGDAVFAVEGAHVGPAIRSVLRDDGFDFVAAQNEVTDDAVGFLAAWEFSIVVGGDFDDLSGVQRAEGEGENEKAFHAEGPNA